jgi:hypothetical protein
MYTSLESTLALRCYFEVDSSDNKPGCIQNLVLSAQDAGPGEGLLELNQASRLIPLQTNL